MLHRSFIPASAALLLASSAGAIDRYWAAPLIGSWNNAANWSLTDGGAPGGGVPQNDDLVYFTGRSICLFDAPIGLPVFPRIFLEGSGSGRTQLIQSDGLLRGSVIRVGTDQPRNDLILTGGNLGVDQLYIGDSPNGEGLLDVSGDASVGPISGSNSLIVGLAEASGTVDISGGTLSFNSATLSANSNMGQRGGPAELMMTDGELDIGFFYIGEGGRGFAQFNGGTTTISTCTVGQAGESGDLRPQMNVGGAGDVDIFGPLTIGALNPLTPNDPGFGRVLLTNGGSLTASQVHIAEGAGTDGELVVDGGSFSAPEIRVGLGGNGLLEVGGGQVFSTMVGIGDAAEGAGLVRLTGGTLFPNTLDVGAAVGSTGFLRMFDGTVDAGFTRIGKAGADGSVTMFGGSFFASTLFIGSGGTAEFQVRNGSVQAGTIVVGETNTLGDQPYLDVQDGTVECNRLLIGSAPGGDGGVFLSGGTVSATEVEVGDDSAGEGRVVMNGGVFNAEEFNIGVLGNGNVSHFSGTIDADVFRVGGGPSYEGRMLMSGGTLIADLIDVRKDGSLFFEFSLSDGLIQSQQLLIGEGAGFSFGDGSSLDARISEVINDGEFRYTDGDGVLSGPLIFNNRLLGQFTNNGLLTLISPTLVPGGFVMNLTNNGLLETFEFDEFIVSGAIANGPDGRIYIRRSFGLDPGFLRSDNANGISNAGDFELQLGVVEIPNGSFTNTGTLSGFGEIRAPLINNGQILPSPTPQPQPRELVVDSLQSGPASSVRVLITENGHNSITSLGSTALDGTLNLAFAPGVPLPPRGTEYDLVVSPNEIIAGNFANVSILGYPCEIISGRNRVYARTLRCSVADLAAPFGVLDLSDINTFVSLFSSGSPLGDLNGDSFLDLSDINAFVGAFTAGCP